MIAALIAGGCGTPADQNDKNQLLETDNSKVKIGVFIAQNGNEFTSAIGTSAKERGEELGYDVSLFDGKSDQNTQIEQIECCIMQDYSAMIIEPVSYSGLNSVFLDALNAGITVVTINQTCEIQEQLTSFVGTDREDASYWEAKTALEAIGGTGKVCILRGQAGTSGEVECSDGFERALAEYPDVEVLESQSADWHTDAALEITETWLQKYVHIDAILAQDDPMALGAIQACIGAGRQDIVITGHNGDSAALAAIQNGQMLLTGKSDPEGMGRIAAEVADCAARGEAVDPEYKTSTAIITADNVINFLD